MSYYSIKSRLPFGEVVSRLTTNLQEKGFGVVTSIDMQDAFRQKLNVSFRRYKVLGACHPEFAYQAISLESHVGVLLPCNVAVQEHENGEVEVTAINPVDSIGRAFSYSQFDELAAAVGNSLREAVDNLHRAVHEKHNEALPT